MLITDVSKILVDENIFSNFEFTTLNRTELIEILHFGHPELSKNLSLCLFKADMFVFFKVPTLLI